MTATMAQRTPLSREHFVYFLIFLAACLLRFAALGAAPLNEFEASSALPAAQLAEGGQPPLGGQPGYVLLTSLLFGLFGSSEFLARFLPALFGVAVAMLPYFWRDLLGRKTALVLALFLAIDPGLVAVSRLAAGNMLAVAGALLALTAWRYGQPALASGLAALALLSAPSIYFGIGAALLVWAMLRAPLQVDGPALRKAAFVFLAVLLLGGTLLFRVPQGLSGVGQVFSAFFGGLNSFPGLGVLTIFLALLGYAFPALIFGGLGALRAWRQDESVGKILSLFAASAFLLILLNPSRQAADLLWVVLPLWVLAATEMSSYLHAPEEEPAAAIGEAGLMLLLAAFLVPTLARIANQAVSPQAIIVLFVLGIAGLATALIALGWSRRSAFMGLVWALALISVVFLLSASSRFSHLETASANELWSPGPAAGHFGLLLTTVDDLSFWDQGQADALPIEVRVESAALQWALRNYEQSDSGSSTLALAITTAEGETPAEFASYRGQSFALSAWRAWEGWPPNFFAWLLFRQAPTQTQQAILWANANLFPDAEFSVQAAPEGTTP